MPDIKNREVADTEGPVNARRLHGQSKDLASSCAQRRRLCRATGSSTAAERGMPDQVHCLLQARARGLNRSKRCPSSSSMNCGDRMTGMIPQGGAIMSCVSWGERHTKGREAQRSRSARTEQRLRVCDSSALLGMRLVEAGQSASLDGWIEG